MKYEGISFLYTLMDGLGWDTLNIEDLEIIMATVKNMEPKDGLSINALDKDILPKSIHDVFTNKTCDGFNMENISDD